MPYDLESLLSGIYPREMWAHMLAVCSTVVHNTPKPTEPQCPLQVEAEKLIIIFVKYTKYKMEYIILL